MLIILLILSCFFAVYLARRNLGVLIAFAAAGQQLIKFIFAMFMPIGRFELSSQTNMFLVMASVGTVLFFSTNMAKRVKKVLPQKVMLLPAMLSIWLLFGLTYTPDYNYGLQKWLGFTAINVLPALYVGLLLYRFDHFKSFILWVCIFCMGYATILFIVIILQGYSEIDLRNITIQFGESRFDGGIWLGRMVGIAILSLFALPRAKSGIHLCVKLFWGIVAFIYLFLAGSRGPAVFLPVAVCSFLLLNYGIKSMKTTLGIIAIGLCIVGILNWVPSPAIKRIKENPFEKAASGITRIDIYERAYSVWKENIFWGLGTGGFGSLYPHNIFLEFGAENGIPAVVIFTFWIIVILGKYFRLKRHIFIHNDLRVIDWTFCIFLYAVLNAQVSGSLITNDWVWYGGILCYRAIDLAREKAFLEWSTRSIKRVTEQTRMHAIEA